MTTLIGKVCTDAVKTGKFIEKLGTDAVKTAGIAEKTGKFIGGGQHAIPTLKHFQM